MQRLFIINEHPEIGREVAGFLQQFEEFRVVGEADDGREGEILVQRATTYAADSPFGSLTPREREILDLLAKGLAVKEIGEKLFISSIYPKRSTPPSSRNSRDI